MHERTPLLTTRQAADYLGVQPRMLEMRRHRGGGPPFVRLSARAVRYRMSDLDDFIERRLRNSTSDPGPGAE